MKQSAVRFGILLASLTLLGACAESVRGVGDRTNRRATRRGSAGRVAAPAWRAPGNTDASAASGIADDAGSVRAMTIDLSADDIDVLRESLALYLADFRREVAGTENPEMRHRLQRKQNALEAILARLGREAAA